MYIFVKRCETFVYKWLLTIVNIALSSYWANDPKGELQPTASAGSQNIMMMHRFTFNPVFADVLATRVGAPLFY